MSSRRDFLKQSAGSMAAATLVSSGAVAGASVERPNVVWLFGDQHRAQALSCMGDRNVSTPNIDALAGGKPRTAVAGCPLCTPFRGSLLTSRYPHECTPGHDYALPEGLETVAAPYNRAGYRTAYFGKWHVDGRENRTEDERSGKQFVRKDRRGGFETWLAYENNNAQYDCWLHGHEADGSEVPLFQLPRYETDATTELFIDYLKDRGREHQAGRGKPFFAAMSVQPPHSPYVAPEEFTARHRPEDIFLRANVPGVVPFVDEARRDLAGYYAMIENLDWNVGRVVETLRAQGLLENTYIVFFSDHGDMHGSQARILKCLPWEESIRVPFIVSKGGESVVDETKCPRTHTMINHVDMAPTTLGLCGIDAPVGMAGRDFSGYFGTGRDVSGLPDSAYLQLVEPGFRYGFAADRERPWRGVVTADGWKYAVFEGTPWCMYNLNDDPYELANLALDGRFREDRARLQDRLAAWMTATGDSFRMPEIRR